MLSNASAILLNLILTDLAVVRKKEQA